MNNINTLVRHLTRFNLTEKEARCYLYLLRVGPKQPAELKKPLKLYREGIHRVLTSLMNKGMISRVVNGTSKYSAVDLSAALDTQLIAFEHEVEQLEKNTHVLHARLNGHHFITADDGLTYKVPNSIDDHDAFIASLTRFNLTEKEARCYLYLFTHGPQHPTALMHALKTYREDIYRRCTSLVDKGMLSKSIADPSVYVATELAPALDGLMAHREDELHALAEVKEKLAGLISSQSHPEASDIYTFKILKTLREVVGVTAQLIRSAEIDLIFIAPPRMLNLFSTTGILDEYTKVVDRGVHVRGITDVSLRNQGAAGDHINAGMHLRHVNGYRGIAGVIVDGKQSISVIHADLDMSISPDANVTVLWSDSPEQATYLANTFELIWDRAIDAEERIHELSGQKRVQSEVVASVY